MKFVVALILLLSLQNQFIIGQNHYTGKTFINDRLDQIDFINDSVLTGSFLAYPRKYEFINDSLRLRFLDPISKIKVQHSYKLLYLSFDTLSFVFTSLSYDRPDTMTFINISKLITNIKNFESFRVEIYGFIGSKRLIINKDKTVKIGDKADVLPYTEFPHYRYFTLTDKKYKEFIDTLSNCLVFRLPKKRSSRGIDVTFVDFEIHTNGITIESKGARLSKIHDRLVCYLLSMF